MFSIEFENSMFEFLFENMRSIRITSTSTALLRVTEANEVPISSHIWVTRRHSKSSKSLKKSKKVEINFYNHLRLAKSFKPMNQPELTRPDHDAL